MFPQGSKNMLTGIDIFGTKCAVIAGDEKAAKMRVVKESI